MLPDYPIIVNDEDMHFQQVIGKEKWEKLRRFGFYDHCYQMRATFSGYLLDFPDNCISTPRSEHWNIAMNEFQQHGNVNMREFIAAMNELLPSYRFKVFYIQGVPPAVAAPLMWELVKYGHYYTSYYFSKERFTITFWYPDLYGDVVLARDQHDNIGFIGSIHKTQEDFLHHFLQKQQIFKT